MTEWDKDEDFPMFRALGWRECGEPESVQRAMFWYLAGIQERSNLSDLDEAAGRGFLYRPDPNTEDPVVLLLAYVADAAGWTEHGGSIGAPWLTEDGKTMLASLALAVVEPRE